MQEGTCGQSRPAHTHWARLISVRMWASQLQNKQSEEFNVESCGSSQLTWLIEFQWEMAAAGGKSASWHSELWSLWEINWLGCGQQCKLRANKPPPPTFACRKSLLRTSRAQKPVNLEYYKKNHVSFINLLLFTIRTDSYLSLSM